MKGPSPEPRALKLLKGTRKDRINDSEPLPRSVLPVCPDDVAPEVREVWDYTLAELVAMRTAAAADRDALLCYCHAVVTHRKACRLLKSSDVLMKGRYDAVVRNPAVAIQRDAAFAIRQFAQEFGLTPSARTRIEVDQDATSAVIGNPFSGTGS